MWALDISSRGKSAQNENKTSGLRSLEVFYNNKG